MAEDSDPFHGGRMIADFRLDALAQDSELARIWIRILVVWNIIVTVLAIVALAR